METRAASTTSRWTDRRADRRHGADELFVDTLAWDVALVRAAGGAAFEVEFHAAGGASRGLGVGDVDGNCAPDLLAAGFDDLRVLLHR